MILNKACEIVKAGRRGEFQATALHGRKVMQITSTSRRHTQRELKIKANRIVVLENSKCSRVVGEMSWREQRLLLVIFQTLGALQELTISPYLFVVNSMPCPPIVESDESHSYRSLPSKNSSKRRAAASMAVNSFVRSHSADFCKWLFHDFFSRWFCEPLNELARLNVMCTLNGRESTEHAPNRATGFIAHTFFATQWSVN